MPDATLSSPENDNVQEFLSFHDGDLIIQTSDTHEFKVHKLVMSLASVVFLDMASLDDVNVVSMEIDSLPKVAVVESASVMDILLRYIYPAVRPSFDSLETIMPALAAADKYIMSTVVNGLEDAILAGDFVEKEPLRLYMLGTRYYLPKLKKAAFKGAVYSTTQSLTPYQAATESAWFSFEEFYKLKFFATYRVAKCKGVLSRETRKVHRRVCDCIKRQRAARLDVPPKAYRLV